MNTSEKKELDSKSKSASFSRKSHRTQTRSASHMQTRSKSKKAATKIQRFFKRTETPRKIAFLKAVCSDSGECVMFGKEIQKIKRVFNEFKLKHTDSLKIRRIGAVSHNGFVVELPFTRNGYTAHGVLKSSATPEADNLFYEAFVGIFINKLMAYYPCFVETYASYFYNDKTIYEKLKEGDSVNKEELVKGIIENKPLSYDMIFKRSLLKNSCEESQYYAVLTQHIKGATSIQDQMVSLKNDKDFFTVHLITYLFQVYCPLSIIANNFTHYDLHTGNVLIYTPSKCNHEGSISYSSSDKYIRMIYHYSDGSDVEFNTFGIAKIIDYGRCYVNDEPAKISSSILNYELCEVDNECGAECGYSTLEREIPYGSFHYICSQKRNMSHDMRLINIIWRTNGKWSGENCTPLRQIIANTVYVNEYALKKNVVDHGYGTPEVSGEFYHEKGDPIKNVGDVHRALKYLIKKEPYFALENERIFKGKKKIGEMHIWVDVSKPMKYVPFHPKRALI
jgi:hypothetical protein